MPSRWDENARVRGTQIESGLDLTFSKVFVPFFANALRRRKPKTVLEVGGGTGHLARELVGIVEKYVVIEPSAGMYSVARKTLEGVDVELHNESVENLPKLKRQFDLALSHLCIQAVSDMDAFLEGLASALTADGMYLLTLPHPAFYNEYKGFFPSNSFRYMEEQAAIVNFSVTLDPNTVISGIPYHHRPISRYFTGLSRAGLAVSSFDEIYPHEEIQSLYGAPWITPRYLVFGGFRAETLWTTIPRKSDAL